MCFVTSSGYTPKVVLVIDLKTPYLADPTTLEGTVLGSKEMISNILYETRVSFSKLSPQAEFVIKKIIENFKGLERGNNA